MATITKFEELKTRKLACGQTNDFLLLVQSTSLAKDYELTNQMNVSSGSVKDCIAESFERFGNNEFKNFLVMAKSQMVHIVRNCTDAWIEACVKRKIFLVV